MPYLLNIIYLALSMLLLPLWAWRIIRGRHDVGGFWRRLFGVAPRPNTYDPVIWMHGACVGELQALRPLVERFEAKDSQFRIVVSAYTRHGLYVANETWPNLPVFYLPFDLSWAVRRVYRSLNPALLILSELELWPNLLLEAKRRQVPVAVVSSRINDADMAFLNRINRLVRSSLGAVRWWGAQTNRDAERIRSLPGTSTTVVEVTGSLKFDVTPTPDVHTRAADLRRLLGFSNVEQILVAGSTHAPEEELLLNVFRDLRRDNPGLRLVLVPRHTGRVDEITRLAKRRGVFSVLLSEIHQARKSSEAVTIVDSVGELTTFWTLADYVFVGGTLALRCGGQSMIEPALLGKPICFGPHVWNFQQIATGLLDAGAACEVTTESEVVDTIAEWLAHPSQAEKLGKNALRFATAQKGAAEKTMAALYRLGGDNNFRRTNAK